MNCCRNYFYFIMLFFVFIGSAKSQDSLYMRTLAHWNGAGTEYNDVWGLSINGAEIAVLGSEAQIHFFNVTNPSNISLIYEEVGGVSTIWRDMKSYGNYVYAVSDASTEGLHIFDLTGAPASISKVLTTTAFFEKAHNIFIDEANARLYACGTDTQGNGLVVLDLSTPSNPTLLSSVSLTGGYIHDLYVSNNIAYCNSGNDGYFIFNFTDPAIPVYLGSYLAPNPGYNHSSWNTANNRYAIFAEELPSGKPLRIIDISNPAAITLKSSWKEPLLAPTHVNNRPHNPYILNNWAYVSYYSDGVQILDITDKTNPYRIAYYDTSDNTTYGGFPDVWGVYPFLPSGIILASDIEDGLYIFEIDFGIPLPVEFTHFEVKKSTNSKHSLLSWETALEVNNSHFDIERSSDGSNFQKIGKVDGQINSNKTSKYEFIDRFPQRGHNFYRLKQVDLSENIDYSDVHLLSFEANSPSLMFYPNPGNGKSVNLDFESPLAGKYEAFILDGTGKRIYFEEFLVDTNPVSKYLRIDFPQTLPAGSYHLVVLKDSRLYKSQVYLVN